MRHDEEDIRDALSVDVLVEEILRRRAEIKLPHLFLKITEDVVREHFPEGADERVIRKAVTNVDMALWMKLADEVKSASPQVKSDIAISGHTMFVGRVSKKPEFSGKDCGAMARCEDRRDAI